MANKLPGVYTTEVDLSQSAEEVGGSTGLFVGLARKGMINSAVRVGSPKQFIDTFGIPPSSDTDFAAIGALEYLPVSPVYFTRISTDDMKYGKVDPGVAMAIASGDIDVTPIDVVANIAVSGVSGQTVVSKAITGGTLTTELSIATGAIYSPKPNVRNSADFIEDAEKELEDTGAGILFSSIGPDSDSDLVGITLENFEAFGVTADSVSVTYKYDQFPARLGDYATETKDAFKLGVSYDAPVAYELVMAGQKQTGTDLLVFDETSIATTTDSLGMRFIPAGSTFYAWSTASGTAAVEALMPVIAGADVTATAPAVSGTTWYKGFNGISGICDLVNYVNKTVDGRLVPVCPWYDRYDFVPASVTTDMERIGKSGNIWQSVFKVSVFRKADKFSSFGNAVETFYGTIGDVFADDGTNLNIKTAINGKSKYIYVATKESVDGNVVVPKSIVSGVNAVLTYNGDIRNPSGTFGMEFVPVSFGKGNSGSDSRVGDYQSAYNLYANKRDVTIDIIAQVKPMKAHVNMIDGLISARKDCRATVQVGETFNTSYDAIMASDISVANPSYVTKYSGWVKKFDSYNRKYRWLPMSIMGAMVQAKTVTQFKVSAAPAGVRRGVLPIEGMYRKFSDVEIEQMLLKNINTAMWMNGVGYVVWGQRTALALNSALREVQVRATLLQIERACESTLNSYVFEGNTPNSRARVSGNLGGILSRTKGNEDIADYFVLCDETNNPPAVVDNNEMNVAIAVTPVRTSEVINLAVIITKTGVTLSEVVG